MIGTFVIVISSNQRHFIDFDVALFFMSTSLPEGQLKRVFELLNLAKDLTREGKVEQPIVTKSCKNAFWRDLFLLFICLFISFLDH
ncbi:hypothetical protein CYL31_20640 [Marinomonas sp. A3A]|nr:hypothetical protein CYL31_20640 [Marinomonas sp. A3A]